jgi:hypothetical protein
LASVVFEYFDDGAVLAMESLMIGIGLIWNIDANPVTNVKSFH